jgi:hypothetical protein
VSVACAGRSLMIARQGCDHSQGCACLVSAWQGATGSVQCLVPMCLVLVEYVTCTAEAVSSLNLWMLVMCVP